MKRIIHGFLLVVALICFRSSAAPLAVGDALLEISAQDQFGTNFVLTTNVQFLLVAVEMDSAKLANQKLAALGADFLKTNRAAYLMDVHTMPAVARFFAFPKLRRYPHSIVLVDSAETLANIPAQANRVSVLKISAGRIERISYWNPATEDLMFPSRVASNSE